MSPTPDWVRALKLSSPQGTDLLKAERDKSNISVEKLSNLLFTKEVLERKQRVLSILQAEKVSDKSQNYFDGRVERFRTALARAKKLRQLQVKNNWDSGEFMAANELISEPGPYGLHESMYLVILFCFLVRELILNGYRQHSVIKAHLNNTNSFSSQQRTTKPLDAMHRQNWVTARMYEDLRQLQRGVRRIKLSLYIHPISPHLNGGLVHWGGQQIMQ
jgi:Acyl-coenzyme A oxidase N-terminal